MIQHWSQKIADYLISQDIIDKDEFDIYVYGYETAISGVIDFLMVCIIGCIIHQLYSTLAFLLMFISVRLYVGGIMQKPIFNARSRLSLFIYWYCYLVI